MTTDTVPSPQDAVHAPGPWRHSFIAANGARFHIAEMGSGPVVLLLHGFPTFWWTWRLVMPRLADAGYRAVAMDLRGYGGSDHTPHGYDPFTLAGDASGVIRSLGERDAVVVGHGWGGLVAWSVAVLEPETVRSMVAVSMPHPAVLRDAIVNDPGQRRASLYTLGYQLPFSPERRLLKHDAAEVGRLLSDWSVRQEWLDDETERRFRRAFQYRSTAHCALEYHRWAIRSIPRPDGVRYAHRMEPPARCPVLQIHGAADSTVLPTSVDGSEDYVVGPYRRADFPGVGHFPHEEDPQRFLAVLMDWLSSTGS